MALALKSTLGALKWLAHGVGLGAHLLAVLGVAWLM